MGHERHIQLVGWFHIVMGALGLFIVGIIFSIGMFFGLFSRLFVDTSIAPFIFGMLILYLLVTPVPMFLVGLGLVWRKTWARYAAIILSLFSIFNFPIGTALSVYTIWALFSDEADYYFHGTSRRYFAHDY